MVTPGSRLYAALLSQDTSADSGSSASSPSWCWRMESPVGQGSSVGQWTTKDSGLPYNVACGKGRVFLQVPMDCSSSPVAHVFSANFFTLLSMVPGPSRPGISMLLPAVHWLLTAESSWPRGCLVLSVGNAWMTALSPELRLFLSLLRVVYEPTLTPVVVVVSFTLSCSYLSYHFLAPIKCLSTSLS